MPCARSMRSVCLDKRFNGWAFASTLLAICVAFVEKFEFGFRTLNFAFTSKFPHRKARAPPLPTHAVQCTRPLRSPPVCPPPPPPPYPLTPSPPGLGPHRARTLHPTSTPLWAAAAAAAAAASKCRRYLAR